MRNAHEGAVAVPDTSAVDHNSIAKTLEVAAKTLLRHQVSAATLYVEDGIESAGIIRRKKVQKFVKLPAWIVRIKAGEPYCMRSHGHSTSTHYTRAHGYAVGEDGLYYPFTQTVGPAFSAQSSVGHRSIGRLYSAGPDEYHGLGEYPDTDAEQALEQTIDHFVAYSIK